ncbi:hypothetical protein [Spirosoma agri]|uniref:Uncharacterized protein n=1 Tax=Spirosoma agri TaxID=1987381 RepID=A0A6M0II69_9BACT|nr:hypothetical protein [Spirosoma agri]NEU67939.1 hypothetical protein [Spirosoma agri]
MESGIDYMVYTGDDFDILSKSIPENSFEKIYTYSLEEVLNDMGRQSSDISDNNMWETIAKAPNETDSSLSKAFKIEVSFDPLRGEMEVRYHLPL